MSSGLGMGDGVLSFLPPKHGLILLVVARILARDFLFLILFLLPFSSLGLKTSFFWNGEYESPRTSPGEREAN